MPTFDEIICGQSLSPCKGANKTFNYGRCVLIIALQTAYIPLTIYLDLIFPLLLESNIKNQLYELGWEGPKFLLFNVPSELLTLAL